MFRFSVIAILLLTVSAGTAQSVYTEFGKNRVQYHDDFDDWLMYETDNFVTYWYGKGRKVAETVIQIAELDNDMIQDVLEHRLNDKIEIIVYIDLSDLKQTNIGAEELFQTSTGRTKVIGNKMFVQYNGNHQDLRSAIRQGIATVYLESMLYGKNFQEVVQNAVLLQLPEWYKQGLVTYIAEDWSAETDGRFRDIFMLPDGKNKDFFYLARDHPEIAGQSMWNYIGREYGRSSISNLLYLSRINRSYESAFLYVVGKEFESVIEDWRRYYEQTYSNQDEHLDDVESDIVVGIRNKRNLPITSMELSEDGRTLAYALNDIGKVKVYVRDLESGKTTMVLKTGTRNNAQEPDYNYPLLSWRPETGQLAILYERRDIIYLTLVNPNGEVAQTQSIDPQYQRVYSMDFWDQDTLIFAATNDGFADLYKYMPKTRQSIRISNDFYDDLDAGVCSLGHGTKGILFSSNRTNLILKERKLDTLLPLENFDVYFMYPDSGTWRLLNFTQTPYVNERQPMAIGPSSVIYLSNESGIWNRKAVHGPLSDQTDIDYITRYNRNIIRHTSVPGVDRIFEHVIKDCRHLLIESQPTAIEPIELKKSQDPSMSDDRPESNMDRRDVVDDRYLFQSKFEKPRKPVPEAPAEDTLPVSPSPEIPAEFLVTPSTDKNPVMYDPSKVVRYVPSRAIAHRLRFKLDYVTATLDNSLLFTELDAYAATKQQYENPPLGILIKANIKDLFEDYVIEGGARFPTTFNGSEYYLFLDNRKRRIDKRFALYRKTLTETQDESSLGPEKDRFITVIGSFRALYPIDAYRSVRGTAYLRNDRHIVLATNINNLETPIDDAQRLGLKFEYVFDNTIEIDVNYLNGTRYKVWAELVKKFDLNLFEGGESLEFNKGFMTVLGVDFRHYQRLDRHAILATRFVASTSFGSERNLYYLGGVENWLFSSFDNTIPVPSDENFAYQTITSPLRGFKYNARNGSSTVLINTELRVPFVKYFSRKRIRSSLLRNLQIVGFVDVGTAWHGPNPFSAENPLNTLTLTNPPTVVVDVKYYRNPIVIGYGGGVRTQLLGYFLKLDYGWGLDTGKVTKPILHFSLGTDF